ncbi:MAG: hypothetical protein CMH23_07025 [Methylophaga sp.]|uniref:hypothetical protein n=1 Tax=Methylophaga sp. TaxID=2024840 RepID=UPI000C8D282A|nr:hypothetical protein [Methylophaga sp.]MBN46211.1 hypothetical protein [Methylophaga sp.]|tara:strand:- start:12694 stop:13047 length:354 start_codon:yes stop_codon:yes gene_type:complete
MSIDQFYNRVYNRQTYNCAHFVAEVWAHITGRDITHILKGFLLPPKDRYVRAELRRQFEKLTEPKSPCIVLMQRPKTVPHVGLFYNGKVFQIHERGVEFQPLDVATRGFKKVGFYAC